jgi:hypothetical protein
VRTESARGGAAGRSWASTLAGANTLLRNASIAIKRREEKTWQSITHGLANPSPSLVTSVRNFSPGIP